jgi:hypothetical protein
VADRRADRQRDLWLYLRVASLVALVLAATGALVPGSVGRFAAGGAVATLVSAPLIRVLWLAVRWARKGDWRFSAAAVAVVGIALSGALLA